MPYIDDENPHGASRTLGLMSHDELLIRRRKAGSEEQKKLAPAEHRAFAREYVEENPGTGPAAIYAGSIGYQLAKALGLHGSRSGVDPDQVRAAFQGVAEGQRRNRAGGSPRVRSQKSPYPKG
jgi:hypothetical protein